MTALENVSTPTLFILVEPPISLFESVFNLLIQTQNLTSPKSGSINPSFFSLVYITLKRIRAYAAHVHRCFVDTTPHLWNKPSPLRLTLNVRALFTLWAMTEKQTEKRREGVGIALGTYLIDLLLLATISATNIPTVSSDSRIIGENSGTESISCSITTV